MKRYIYLLLLVILVVLVVPRPRLDEGYINFECKVIKNEGSSSTCDGYGTIADEAVNWVETEGGGKKMQKYIKCCKPEQPRVCIYDTCVYEDDYKWLKQAPVQVKGIEVEGQQTKKIAMEGKYIAIDAKKIAVDARGRAIKAHGRADEAWELADRAYRSSGASSAGADKEIKEIKKDIAALKDLSGLAVDERARKFAIYAFRRSLMVEQLNNLYRCSSTTCEIDRINLTKKINELDDRWDNREAREMFGVSLRVI